jgi:hypothetical protein
MDSRKLVAWMFTLACMAAHAQTTVDMHALPPPLPGSAQAGHFHFQAKRTPDWTRNLGKGIARSMAYRHKMTGGPLVQYASPDRTCKFARDRSCP